MKVFFLLMSISLLSVEVLYCKLYVWVVVEGGGGGGGGGKVVMKERDDDLRFYVLSKISVISGRWEVIMNGCFQWDPSRFEKILATSGNRRGNQTRDR